MDVGSTDFTLEFFLKMMLADVTGTGPAGNDGWITGNIVFDRDIWGPGDFGDFGVALGRVGQTRRDGFRRQQRQHGGHGCRHA